MPSDTDQSRAGNTDGKYFCLFAFKSKAVIAFRGCRHFSNSIQSILRNQNKDAAIIILHLSQINQLVVAFNLLGLQRC